MNIKKEELHFYTNSLKYGSYFSFVRWRDGEWNCMFGKDGENCDGVKYTKKLQLSLFKALRAPSPRSFNAMQSILPEDLLRAEAVLSARDEATTGWVDGEVFNNALVAGKLFPFILQLQKKRIFFVGNENHEKLHGKVFLINKFFCVGFSDAFDFVDKAVSEIPKSDPNDGNTVILFAAGPASNVMIRNLERLLDNTWLIDVGALFDPFVGIKSRTHHDGITEETLKKNLGQ